MTPNCARLLCSLFLLDFALGNFSEFPTFENGSDLVLNHLAIDRRTGHLYVAAVNRIFHLNENLETLESVSTGPRLDNALCTTDFGKAPCSDGGTVSYPSIPTDNTNKILAIDYDNGRLITCGSVFQGTCQTRSLDNLSDVYEPQVRGRSDYFVAANSANRSTVAFIGRGPDDQSALYVGGTYTGGLMRQSVPAVSSRGVAGPGAFRFAYFDGLTGGTAIHLRREALEKYLVTYVGGFAAGDFAYFLTVQPERFDLESSGTPPRISENYVSKIVQVCRYDRKFYSYAEIPIRCGSNDDYNILLSASFSDDDGREMSSGRGILVAAFAKSQNKNSPETSEKDSVVCLYRLPDVRSAFTRNVRRCFAAEQTFVGAQFSARLCTKLNWNITDGYCGEAEQNGPLVGTIPLRSSSVVVVPSDALVTSTAATFLGDDVIVLFLGTSEGVVHKVALQPEMTYHAVEEIPVDVGSSVNRDMIFDPKGMFVYAMTNSKVVKIPTSKCHLHLTCNSCHSVRDPYCGWCYLERRCSTKASCVNSHLEKRWLKYDSGQCISEDTSHSVYPTKIGIRKSVQVTTRIKSLPPLYSSEKYVCFFGSTDLSSIAVVVADEIRCQIPQPAVQNTIKTPDRTDHVNVTLSLFSTASNVSFFETSITFYNCSQHISCTLCTTALWVCHWCSDINACGEVDDFSECFSKPISRPEMCPHLIYPNDSTMFVSADVVTQLRILGRHFPSPINVSYPGYQCVIHLVAPPVVLSARRVSSDEVICDAFLYSYSPEEPEKIASVEVTWNRDFYIDDFYGVSVTIYKCEGLASDCSTCLSLQESPHSTKYNCQWCNSRCRHNSTCGTDQVLTCPIPSIHNIFPLSGPLEGGTLLTVTGLNLGRSFDNIRNSISVAGVPCEVLPKQYLVSRRVVCKTGPTTKPKQAQIILTIGEAAVSWESEFKYQRPEITSIFPRIGPVAGGTVITFHGHDLDVGGIFKVLLDYIPCVSDSEQRNSTVFTCATVPVLDTMVLEIVVVFDEVFQRTGKTFEYKENPTIHEIFPLASFASGGRVITITGDSLTSVQGIVFHLSKENFIFNSSCFHVNSSRLLCLSPKIKNETLSPKSLQFGSDTEFCEFEISFTMDGVTSVLDLPLHYPGIKSTFTVVSDPEFRSFDNGHRIYHGEALILGKENKSMKRLPIISKGQNLNLACGATEATVYIGMEMCKVNSMDAETIYCLPPVYQPNALDFAGRRTGQFPIVKVVIGNFMQILGELEYQGPITLFNEYWVIGIGVAGGAVFTVIVIVLVVYQRKSSEAVRQFQKLQFHLNTMEINIRNECKQAFAELQTEVSDFTSDLNSIGIPFWDYKVYLHKNLFPAHPDYSVLRFDLKANEDRCKCYDGRLQNFKQLLDCSQFLLIFIHTLEHQKNFSIRDKSIVASLLVIVLHDKMHYMTEILKCLLNDLIDRCIEKRQVKLMLRRNESVAERLLTNWLTLCMYDHLRDDSGKALFMLFKAIKHQIEKGPVDAVTSEAKYALMEDRLLQQNIEAKALAIHLLPGGNFPYLEPTACKMLDCDTVTQAKEKALDAIFLNAPFSFRPSVLDIDFEWESPSRGIIILNDDDVTTATDRGWLKINTLAHYCIPDGATLTIVPQRKKDFSLPACNVLDVSHSPVSSMTPFFMSEEGSKFYHLAKHDDSQQAGRSQKVISEIFLTRLLATKCTLQQYIDDLFATMLNAGSSLPPAIKYLFDFLDSTAAHHNIIDPEVTHIWKSNSLLLRFWIGLIKKPEFVFDINKSIVIDSCLSTIAQTVVDTCSTQMPSLGKDSPSSKLLFAKDIPRYRQLLSQFYREIQELPLVTDEEMSKILLCHSQTHTAGFNSDLALKDLYKYAAEYNYELLEALDGDSFAQKLHLGKKFKQACRTVEGNNFY